MQKFKLTREEQRIENALLRGEYRKVTKKRFKEIARMIKRVKTKETIKIKISQNDLALLKKKSADCGLNHRAFISELLSYIAHMQTD